MEGWPEGWGGDRVLCPPRTGEGPARRLEQGALVSSWATQVFGEASGRALVCWAYSQWQKLLNSARGGDITGPGIYGNPSPCLLKLGIPGGLGLER